MTMTTHTVILSSFQVNIKNEGQNFAEQEILPAENHLIECYNIQWRLRWKADTTLNEQGHKKVFWPRSGPLNVQLYPSEVIESTSSIHSNFLLNLLGNLKKQKLHYNVVAAILMTISDYPT